MNKPTKLDRNCREVTGMGIAEYFDSCLGTRMTISRMAKELNVSRSTIDKWIKKTGRKWDADVVEGNRRAVGFEYMGFFGTQKGLCLRHGVNYNTVRTYVVKVGLPFVDALEKHLRGKELNKNKPHGIKKRMAELGVSQANVYEIKRYFGITSLEALEIAVSRKKAREAAKAAREAV